MERIGLGNGVLKTVTSCCALCQVSGVRNDTPIENLQEIVENQRKEALANTDVGKSDGTGQSNIFIICSPGEKQLEENLIKLGFTCVSTNVSRRVGYPPGLNKMYLINLLA